MPEPGESPTNPAPNDDAFADFSDIVKALQDTSGGENAQGENVVNIKDNISTNLVPDIKKLVVTSENQKNAFGAAQEERMNEEQNLESNRLEAFRDFLENRVGKRLEMISNKITEQTGSGLAGFLKSLFLIGLPGALLVKGTPFEAAINLISSTLVAIRSGLATGIFRVINGIVKLPRLILTAFATLFKGTGVFKALTSINNIRSALAAVAISLSGFPKILTGINLITTLVTKIVGFVSFFGGLLSKIASPFVTFFKTVAGIFPTVSRFFGIIGGLLGKIALPTTVILGLIRGLTDFFKGENKGIGSLLKNVFNGLLETFTFGLLDIERIIGFFDQIITSVKQVIVRIKNLGRDSEESDRLRRAYEERREKREESRADRIAAREGKKTRKTIEETASQDISQNEILGKLSDSVREALSLTRGRTVSPEISALTESTANLAVAIGTNAQSMRDTALQAIGGGPASNPQITPSPVIDPFEVRLA